MNSFDVYVNSYVTKNIFLNFRQIVAMDTTTKLENLVLQAV